MGHLLKLNCAHSPMNVRILSSTIPFSLTMVQLPNLALSHKKRIIVYKEQSLHEKLLHDPNHKVLIRIYRAPQCMSPRRNWDSPKPSPASECALPPPGPKGGGAYSPATKGVGESQLRRLEKKAFAL
jgi:hypothetical protein